MGSPVHTHTQLKCEFNITIKRNKGNTARITTSVCVWLLFLASLATQVVLMACEEPCEVTYSF